MDVSGATWRKSTFSGGNNDCVEMACVTGVRLVRDSKNPEGPVLTWTPAALRALLDVTKRGRFDD